MFKIVVITPETDHPDEAKILSTLVSDYNCIIHIRKPNFSIDAYKTYLQKYNHLLHHFVLHEHHSLVKYFPVKGIHLKESDRRSNKEIPNGAKVVSTSLHTIEDVKNLSHEFEYIFYSPLFESISKVTTQPHRSLNESSLSANPLGFSFSSSSNLFS